MHYDGAGPTGWLACLATSDDGTHWIKHGPVLSLGAAGRPDSKSASSPWVIQDGAAWYMFYLGTSHTGPAPGRVPSPPYLTCLAEAPSPTGPWRKRYDVVPFTTMPASYRSLTASPGAVIKQRGQFLQYFSGSALAAGGSARRTIGLASTTDLVTPWTVQPEPLLPVGTDVENSSIYYEASDGGWWWLFTNHVHGICQPG